MVNKMITLLNFPVKEAKQFDEEMRILLETGKIAGYDDELYRQFNKFV